MALGGSPRKTPSAARFTMPTAVSSHLLVDIPCVTDTTTGATTVPCIIPPGAIFEPNNPAAIPFTAPFGSGPSGIVANPYPGAFREANGQPAQFIYTTLDGLIVAWNPANGDNAVVEANQFLSCTSPPFGPGSCTSYQGLAIAGPPNDPHLYATNLFSEVDVFDKRFNYVGSFAADADISSLPTGEQPFVPYGIQAIGDKLYVTYYAIFYPSGNGLVDVCDLRTSTTTLFCQRIIDTTCEGPQVRHALRSPRRRSSRHGVWFSRPGTSALSATLC